MRAVDTFGFSREDAMICQVAVIALDRFLRGEMFPNVLPAEANIHCLDRLGPPDPESIRDLIRRLAEVEADQWQDGQTLAEIADPELYGPGQEFEVWTAFQFDDNDDEGEDFEPLTEAEMQQALYHLFNYEPAEREREDFPF